jgi:sirohydrochlorin cobaltochelatase
LQLQNFGWERPVMKKALLIVSFGTTYRAALQSGIQGVEDRIRAAFPGCEVRRAFTSRRVIETWAARDGISIPNERQALEMLRKEGYREVFVQPLHVIAGQEYEKVRDLVIRYAHEKPGAFDRIRIGRPLLYYMGQAGHPDDYLAVIRAIAAQLPERTEREAVVLMGHGGVHPANAAYALLQMKICEFGLRNVFMYIMEGFPALDNVMASLAGNNVKKVILMPFMLVAGGHVYRDMAGEGEQSAQSRFVRAGFDVAAYVHGLGENTAIQDIYVQHVKDIVDSC